jgi:hypothetical protein
MFGVAIVYCTIVLIMLASLPIFQKVFGDKGVTNWMLFWTFLVALLFLMFLSVVTGLRIR